MAHYPLYWPPFTLSITDFTHKYGLSVCRYQWDQSKLLYSHRPWDQMTNQRSFMDDLAKKLNISSHGGWYSVRGADLKRNGGWGLLQKYNGSTSKLLMTIYPEYPLMMREYSYTFDTTGNYFISTMCLTVIGIM